MAWITFLGRRLLEWLGRTVENSFPWLVTHGPCDLSRRALLVRHAEQVHRRPLHGQAEREEPGGEVKGLKHKSSRDRLTVADEKRYGRRSH